MLGLSTYWLLSATLAGAQTSAPSRPPQPLTFGVATRQVQVSVVVQDKDGAPVRGLTAKDFQLFEKGKEQTIESFSVELEAAAPEPAPIAASQFEFSNQLTRGGVTVILLDRLNTAWADQSRAKAQIVKFLEHIRRDDRVGLYLLDANRLRILHDFTTDAGSLLASLARHKALTSAELASADTVQETGDAEMDAFLSESSRMISSELTKRRIEATADGLEAIAGHLRGVRGRKNLIWVSSSFPLVFDDAVGMRGSYELNAKSASNDVEKAARALSDAGIAVYPVDARGLVSVFVSNPSAAASVPQGSRTTGVFATLETMREGLDTAGTLAEDTGGRAFNFTNDLSTAIRRAVDDGRYTYTLGYSPTHDEWNGQFREIKVKVNRPGVEVRHRKGYLAYPLPQHDRTKTGQVLNQTLQNPLQAAGIAVSVRVEPVEGSKDREMNLVIRVDPRPITLERKGEIWQGAVALMVAQSLPSGKTYKDFDQDLEVSLSAVARERMLSKGLILTKKLRLRDDADRLHVLVSDPPTGAVGSVIIPAEKLRAAIPR